MKGRNEEEGRKEGINEKIKEERTDRRKGRN
jgi:hypothetical protein